MLTAKQERFVQNMVKGMTQRQAYKDAYDAENMKDETIDNEAYKLFKNNEIAMRYKELIEKLEDEAIMTAKQRMVWLSDVVRGKVKHISYGGNGEEYENEAYISDKIKAVDTLNKMSGEYVTKIEGDLELTTIKVDVVDE
jgi:phage terminase small subunit